MTDTAVARAALDDPGQTSTSTSVIAAFIKRFREAPPTSPDHRSLPKDKEAFWWVTKSLAMKNQHNQSPSDLLDGDYDIKHDSAVERSDADSSALDTSEGEIPRSSLPVRAEEGSAADPLPAVPVPTRSDHWQACAPPSPTEPDLPSPANLQMDHITPALPILESFLDSSPNLEDEFEFHMGMEELDAKTNLLLEKCELVLQNFKGKSSSPGNEAITTGIVGNAKPMARISSEASAIAGDLERLQSSPVRGLRVGDESIFSLTSVLSDEDEIFNGSAKQDHIEVIKSAVMLPLLDIVEAENSADLIRSSYPEGLEKGGANLIGPPLLTTVVTPPREKSSSSRWRQNRLASPESIHSINGISVDDSGLFMFMSTSDTAMRNTEDEAPKLNYQESAQYLNDSDLSHSTSSYSEDYHRVMKSLDDVEVVYHGKNIITGSDHPRTMMRASKQYLNQNKKSEKSVFIPPNVVTADTVSPYFDDEIVCILWKRLARIRMELKRRAEQ